MSEQLVNNFTTMVVGGIDGSSTSLPVASTAIDPANGNFRLLIGSEYLLVTDIDDATHYTVTRGIEGTSAAAHSAGVAVTAITTVGGFNAWLAGAVSGVLNLNGTGVIQIDADSFLQSQAIDDSPNTGIIISTAGGDGITINSNNSTGITIQAQGGGNLAIYAIDTGVIELESTVGINCVGSPFNLNDGSGTGAGTFNADAATFVMGGAEIGNSASDTFGFWGAAAIAQRASADQAAIPGTGATSTQIATLLNEIRAALVAAGLIKGSA